MSEKVVGYVLVALGVLAILYAGIDVYRVFTGRAKPIQLFKFSGIGLDPRSFLPQDLPPEAQQLFGQGESTKAEVIPSNLINDTSNIFAHFMLMSFIASIGQKIASLGVQLVRPIVVKLRTKESQSNDRSPNT